MFYVTQKTFEHGNKAGHLLAYLTRPDHTPISIPWILTPQGHVSDIVEAFLSFYRDLYVTRVQYSEGQLCDYLAHVTPPFLSTQMREELDAPLSVEELTLAILQLPTCKTPGLDGFPAEWYAHFRHLSCPFLLHTFNKTWRLKSFLPLCMKH